MDCIEADVAGEIPYPFGLSEHAYQELRSRIRESEDPWFDFTRTDRSAVLRLYARLASIPNVASLNDQDFDVLFEEFLSLLGVEKVLLMVAWCGIDGVIDSVGDLLDSMERHNAELMSVEEKPDYPDVLDDAFFQKTVDWPLRPLAPEIDAWGSGHLLVRGRWDVLSSAWTEARTYGVAKEWIDRKWRDERSERAEETMVFFLLGGVWADSRNVIWRLAGGQKVELPDHLRERRVYQLDGRALANVDRPEAPLFRPTLLELLKERPFPFRRCPVCESVFVLERRGKPRRFCSTRCKAKGIPSAANRAQYAKGYRKQKRAEEIEVTKRTMAGRTRTERYAELRKRFPGKSRRQLRYLIKCADQQSGPGNESGGVAE